MSDNKDMKLDLMPKNALQVELNSFSHPAWDEPIICRVEVDLPGWLSQLAGGNRWEVYSEDEDEHCISFSLRELYGSPKNKAQTSESTSKKVLKDTLKKTPKSAPKNAPKNAEVTLYHSGYAVVDVEGQSLFDGALTNGTSQCAHLSYFHAESGEPIVLN